MVPSNLLRISQSYKGVLNKTKNQAALVITHNLRSVRKYETITSILNNNAKLLWPPIDFIISQQWA
jgi:ABC-type Mn2+/Zn2+ transport system ATPase subunit